MAVKRILAVEDDAATARYYEELLSGTGYEVETVPDVTGAGILLERFQSRFGDSRRGHSGRRWRKGFRHHKKNSSLQGLGDIHNRFARKGETVQFAVLQGENI